MNWCLFPFYIDMLWLFWTCWNVVPLLQVWDAIEHFVVLTGTLKGLQELKVTLFACMPVLNLYVEFSTFPFLSYWDCFSPIDSCFVRLFSTTFILIFLLSLLACNMRIFTLVMLLIEWSDLESRQPLVTCLLDDILQYFLINLLCKYINEKLVSWARNTTIGICCRSWSGLSQEFHSLRMKQIDMSKMYELRHR